MYIFYFLRTPAKGLHWEDAITNAHSWVWFYKSMQTCQHMCAGSKARRYVSGCTPPQLVMAVDEVLPHLSQPHGGPVFGCQKIP